MGSDSVIILLTYLIWGGRGGEEGENIYVYAMFLIIPFHFH